MLVIEEIKSCFVCLLHSLQMKNFLSVEIKSSFASATEVWKRAHSKMYYKFIAVFEIN